MKSLEVQATAGLAGARKDLLDSVESNRKLLAEINEKTIPHLEQQRADLEEELQQLIETGTDPKSDEFEHIETGLETITLEIAKAKEGHRVLEESVARALGHDGFDDLPRQ